MTDPLYPPIIDVSGSPYECGYQYGQQAAGLIRETLDRYRELIAHHAGLAGDRAIERVRQYIPVIAQYLPSMLDEIRGVADGCGLSLEEILILNCRTELLSTTPMHECTAMAVLPPASGEVLIGQTWDWLEALRGSALVLRVHREDTPAVTMLAEAGQIGKIGYNSAGLGLCLNWLETDFQRIGVPYLLIARAVLDCAHISQAIDVFSKYPRASSGNYLLAHARGVAINIEATPDQFDFQEPERGVLVHTNHFVSPRFRAADRGLRQEGGDSLIRRQHAANLLDREHGRITGETLKAIQQDTAFGPAAICTSASEDAPPLERWATLAGLVMNLTRREYSLSGGAAPDSCYTPIPE